MSDNYLLQYQQCATEISFLSFASIFKTNNMKASFIYKTYLDLSFFAKFIRNNIHWTYNFMIYTYDIYIWIYICNHDNNVPSQLLPQWLCWNSRNNTSCTSSWLTCTSFAQVHGLPQSQCGDNRVVIVFMITLYQVHLTSVRFKNSAYVIYM